MDVTAVVIHKGALARYTVSQQDGNRFVAHLLLYSGDPASAPPQHINLEKHGRHCKGNVDDEALLDDIYYAAKDELHKRG